MRKKFITRTGSLLLFTLILVACLLSGCTNSDRGIDQTVLTQEKREAISAAYSQSQPGELYWFQTDGLGAYYLGEIEGCIIFYNLRTWDPDVNKSMEYGDLSWMYGSESIRPLNFTIAGTAFSPGFRNQLCAYKDGEVLQLSMAYIKDWISKEGVEKVKIAYDSFIRYLADLGEYGYSKNEKKFRKSIYSQSGSPMEYFMYPDYMLLNQSPEYQLFIKALKTQGG